MQLFTKTLLTFSAAVMLGIALSTGAYAKGGPHEKHHKGHAKHEHSHKHGGKGKHSARDGAHITISLQDRRHIRSYLSSHHCPPGLAKKHNGCLPPGHAKRYMIGQPLPAAIAYYPIPHDLLVQLEPVPVGYEYVRVDRDILLISEATHHVIDAITLLSAVR
jgi:Ni/Co efflux regulator RcnB